MQATRGVDDHDVAQVVDGIAHALRRNLDGILAVTAIDAHAHLVAKGLQLVSGCGTVDVAGDQQRVVTLLPEAIRELGRCGRLA